MKTLNQNSTKIFCALLDRLGEKDYIKIENEPFMALSIEKLGKNYSDNVVHISICHSYVQEGDLMKDPEMCFAVADQRGEEKTNYDHILVVPYAFQQDNIGMYEITMRFDSYDSKVTDEEKQAGQAEFANHWFEVIEMQGFLE